MSSIENWEKRNPGDHKTKRDIYFDEKVKRMVKGEDYQELLSEVKELLKEKRQTVADKKTQILLI